MEKGLYPGCCVDWLIPDQFVQNASLFRFSHYKCPTSLNGPMSDQQTVILQKIEKGCIWKYFVFPE